MRMIYKKALFFMGLVPFLFGFTLSGAFATPIVCFSIQNLHDATISLAKGSQRCVHNGKYDVPETVGAQATVSGYYDEDYDCTKKYTGNGRSSWLYINTAFQSQSGARCSVKVTKQSPGSTFGASCKGSGSKPTVVVTITDILPDGGKCPTP